MGGREGAATTGSVGARVSVAVVARGRGGVAAAIEVGTITEVVAVTGGKGEIYCYRFSRC